MRLRFFLFAASGVFAGCNAILGIESASFDPPEDAAVANDAPGTDASRTDARVEDVVAPPDVVDASDAATTDATDAGDAGEVCAKDCLGGACVGGKCQPFTVIDLGVQELKGLTAAGDNVYWTNNTTRQLQTASGSAAAPPSTVLTLPDGTTFNVGAISSDATHVYFAEEDATDDANVTYRVARAGQTERNGAAETIIDSLAAAPFDVIAESATNIVWNEFAEGRVLRCNVVPCSTIDVVASGEDFPSHLSPRGGRIAWGTLSTKLVRFRSTGGGTPSTFATVDGFVGTVLITKTAVFYSDLGKAFFAHDFTPPSDRVLSPETDATESALDSDGTTIWYASTSGLVAHIPAAGGTPDVVASGLSALSALTIGARGVYWLDTGGVSGHKVMGIAK